MALGLALLRATGDVAPLLGVNGARLVPGWYLRCVRCAGCTATAVLRWRDFRFFLRPVPCDVRFFVGLDLLISLRTERCRDCVSPLEPFVASSFLLLAGAEARRCCAARESFQVFFE